MVKVFVAGGYWEVTLWVDGWDAFGVGLVWPPMRLGWMGGGAVEGVGAAISELGSAGGRMAAGGGGWGLGRALLVGGGGGDGG